MQTQNIVDLKLAGIQWEITETPAVHQITSTKASKPNLTNGKSSHVIVPASAPITLDTINAMVQRPTTIESLARMICEVNHPLKSTAKNVVLPHFATKFSGLLIITDFPSSEDEESGMIISGKLGEMLDKMLGAIDISRDMVSILPLLFWHTPGNRTPTQEELDLAKPFVDRAIELIQPKVILTLGTIATTNFAKVDLLKEHDKPIQTNPNYVIFPTFHPNYLLLKPTCKKDVWNTLQNVQKLLKNQ